MIDRVLSYGQQFLLLACFMVAMAMGYMLGVGWILQDRPFSMYVFVVVASPVMMLAWRLVELRGDFKESLQMFNLNRQSWAFMFGDTFALSYAMLALTNGWQHVPASSWFNSMTWFLVAFGVGVALSLVFALFDSPRYLRKGVGFALISPTKWWHDWVVFPVLMSLLLFTGIPQIFGNWSFHTVMALIPIVGYCVLAYKDFKRDKDELLDPVQQHYEWDAVEFRIRTT